MKTLKHLRLLPVLIGLLSFVLVGCSKDKDGSKGTVTDIDGNIYNTIRIGTQTWMAENLKTTQYNDGTPIPEILDNDSWNQSISGIRCNFENDENNVAIYGRLYNWYAVETGKLCPTGWHVPSFEERTKFVDYLVANGYNYDGSTIENRVAKSLASVSGWEINNETGDIGASPETNNSTGFSALPGGYRGMIFYDLGTFGNWWNADVAVENETRALSMQLNYSGNYLGVAYRHKWMGLSVRCLQND
jgi:uncharacterized protein (TIGR02145 family)